MSKIVYLALINFDIGEKITKIFNTKNEAINFCRDTLKDNGLENVYGIECLVLKCSEDEIGKNKKFSEKDIVWSRGVLGIEDDSWEE